MSCIGGWVGEVMLIFKHFDLIITHQEQTEGQTYGGRTNRRMDGLEDEYTVGSPRLKFQFVASVFSAIQIYSISASPHHLLPTIVRSAANYYVTFGKPLRYLLRSITNYVVAVVNHHIHRRKSRLSILG